MYRVKLEEWLGVSEDNPLGVHGRQAALSKATGLTAGAICIIVRKAREGSIHNVMVCKLDNGATHAWLDEEDAWLEITSLHGHYLP